MEELTKQQIVLVTLLVSFVTSIATGIVTVALMDQAPPGVTQTINRVIERTIEKVTPAPAQNQASVVTKETIVVKEDDLVVSAVEKNTKNLVSIYAVSGSDESLSERFVGNGLVVNKEGLIATDSSVVSPIYDDAQNPIRETLTAVFYDGTILLVKLITSSDTSDIIFLKPQLDDKTKNTVFAPATFVPSDRLKLGQTVIGLGGEKVSVATGIVSSFIANPGFALAGGSETSTTTASNSDRQIIKTDIHTLGKFAGSILVNLSGEVVGIRAGGATLSDNAFLSASAISKLLSSLTKPLKTN